MTVFYEVTLIYNFVIKVNEVLRSICWISFQPDGSVSVGFKNRSFVSPNFTVKNHIFNYYNRVTNNYIIANSPDALMPVKNPHMTFHPPIFFHLRANSQPELFTGYAEPLLILNQDQIVPWLRFVTDPISDLQLSTTPRDHSKTSVITVGESSENYSLGFGVDFVRPEINISNDFFFSTYENWHNYRYHIFCELLPKQLSTLSWYHQC